MDLRFGVVALVFGVWCLGFGVCSLGVTGWGLVLRVDLPPALPRLSSKEGTT